MIKTAALQLESGGRGGGVKSGGGGGGGVLRGPAEISALACVYCARVLTVRKFTPLFEMEDHFLHRVACRFLSFCPSSSSSTFFLFFIFFLSRPGASGP